MKQIYKNRFKTQERPCCNGKTCYDKKSAKTARNYCLKKGRINIRIYHCYVCNKWHLTHK